MIKQQSNSEHLKGLDKKTQKNNKVFELVSVLTHNNYGISDCHQVLLSLNEYFKVNEVTEANVNNRFINVLLGQLGTLKDCVGAGMKSVYNTTAPYIHIYAPNIGLVESADYDESSNEFSQNYRLVKVEINDVSGNESDYFNE